MNYPPPLSSVLCQIHCFLKISPIDAKSSFILSIHRSLGLPLLLFRSNLACSALCGNRSIVILSTCSNHRSLRWTILSSGGALLYPITHVCPMSSFLIFRSLVTPAIHRSQQILAVRIFFSSCFCNCPTFRSKQENRSNHRLVYFLYFGFRC